MKAKTYALGVLASFLVLGAAPGSVRAAAPRVAPPVKDTGRPLWSCPVPVAPRAEAAPAPSAERAPAQKAKVRYTESPANPADCLPYYRYEHMLQVTVGETTGMTGAPDDEDDEAPICVEGDPQCSPTSPAQPPASIRFFVAKGALVSPGWSLPRPGQAGDAPRVLGGPLQGHPPGLDRPPKG